MIKIFKEEKLQVLTFIFLIFIISFLAFWRAFSFDFWGEDWEQLWFAVFDPARINNPLELREHAIVIYEELFLSKFFKFNTFYWQIAGYLLKVLGAFAVSLMTLGLTRSKRAAFFTGLIFASSAGGLGSFTWVAAHASALVIPLLCLGVYFWVIKKNILALLLLLASILADPARGIFGSLIVILWDILSFIQSRAKDSSERFWKRVLILVIATFFLRIFISRSIDAGYLSTLDANISFMLKHPIGVLTNFLNTLGNLIVGWFIPIAQNPFAVSIPTIIGIAVGYLFLFQTIFLLVYFFQKKYESFKILFIFSIWIVVFFLPNWLLANNLMIGSDGQVLGQTHRYLTLSAVGLVCFLGYVISRIQKNFLKGFLLLLVICSNIFISNQILAKESYYRSSEMTKPIWDKIEKDVPVGEENSLFFIRGEDRFRINDISQAKIPFSLRRGIKTFDKWPFSVSDPRTLKELLCGKTNDGREIPLSHLHAWYVRGSSAENISEEVRREFSEIECNQL